MTSINKKYLKIDAHVHSAGVSRCAQKTVEELIDQKIDEGYDGAVLVNHCQPWYYVPHKAGNEQYVRSVLDEYARGQAYAKERGFRLYLGLEVTILNPFYSDWLLYGVTEAFLLEAPALYILSQSELFERCERHGVVLVQAHPFRGYLDLPTRGVGEFAFLHGLEINCSLKDLPHVQKVLEIAQKQHKLVVCGTDFHGKATRGHVLGGIFVPEWVETGVDFARYLKETDEMKLFLNDERINFPVFPRKK